MGLWLQELLCAALPSLPAPWSSARGMGTRGWMLPTLMGCCLWILHGMSHIFLLLYAHWVWLRDAFFLLDTSETFLSPMLEVLCSQRAKKVL